MLPQDQAFRNIARKHALLNALRHEGKADLRAVVSKVLGEQPELRAQIRMLMPVVEGVVRQVNQLGVGEQRQILEREYPAFLAEAILPKPQTRVLPPLPNAEQGKVITRFPPEPNGYPHIGHAKAAIIDETYARLYEGKFVLRFDDTNPAKEKLEYYSAIKEGLDWLGVKPDLIKNTSDDIELFYHHAKALLAAGHAYVCTCEPEKIRSNRSLGQPCDCRTQPPEDVLARWEKMLTTYRPQEAIVRIKVDLQHSNTALRDPTLLRIVDVKHPLRGHRYRVWPTYDFAAPIEDHLDGVTHALRTKEYELRDELYFLLIKLLHLRRPELIEFARLELKGTPVSKRKLKMLFDQGIVSAWDDPRLPTLNGLRRRGITPQAIRQFVLEFGVTKVESEPTWDALQSHNRKVLDPIAKRYFFVPKPLLLEVEGASLITATLRFHPDRPLGERRIPTNGRFYVPGEDIERIGLGRELRLMELYNVTITQADKSKAKGRFTGSEVKPDLPKIQWVTPDHVPFTVLVPGPLFIDEVYNRESLLQVKGLAEAAASQLETGEMVQFSRFGFCRVDRRGVGILAHR